MSIRTAITSKDRTAGAWTLFWWEVQSWCWRKRHGVKMRKFTIETESGPVEFRVSLVPAGLLPDLQDDEDDDYEDFIPDDEVWLN